MNALRLFRRDDPEHAAVHAALPWFVNGTLQAAERGYIEAHLANCIRCRHELEELRKIGALVAGEAADDGMEAALSRAHDRIERFEHGRARFPGYDAVASILASATAALPGGWRTAVAIPVVLVAALSWPVLNRVMTQDGYHTLTSAPVQSPGREYLSIAFERTASSDAMRKLLVEAGADIVNGPSPDGTYVISVADAQPDALADKLREHPIVYAVAWMRGQDRP